VHIPGGWSVLSQEWCVSVRAAHHLLLSWPTEFLQGILTFQDMKSANKRRPPCYWHTQKVFSSSAIFQQIFNQFSIRFLLSDVKKAICHYLLSNQLMHSFFPTTGHSVLAAKLYIPNLRLIYLSSIQIYRVAFLLQNKMFKKIFCIYCPVKGCAVLYSWGDIYFFSSKKKTYLTIGQKKTLKSVSWIEQLF